MERSPSLTFRAFNGMTEFQRYAPATAAEVQQIVAEALDHERRLEVCGGGSKRHMHAPIASGALLDMRRVAGIIDYDPDELVVTAHAGTPLVEIEAALAERRQMLAFEPFDHGPLFGAAAGCATLGGIVAANVSGSRRLSMGAARDHLLGFTAVSGRGETLKGGGAVVKNVTGFDLPKLMAGSWGTLAVLVSVTLRVLPRPRVEKTLLFAGLSDEAAVRLMSTAMALPAGVSAASHVRLPAAVTALRLEGFGPSVEVRSRELLRALGPACAGAAIEAEESSAFWQNIRTLDALPHAGHMLWRISVPPARGWQVQSLIASSDAHYVYDWAGGLVWAAVPDDVPHGAGGPYDAGGPDSAAARIPSIARSLGGHAQLVRARVAMRESLSRAAGGWAAGGDQGLKRLHERLKTAFDPRGILNPGLDLAAEC
jgi:glycolate oxidase FAD binding subunit